MVGVLASCAGDRGFEYRSGQIKYYEIGMCCSSAKQAALRRKIKDQNQDNVGRHFYLQTVVSVSLHYNNPTKSVGLVQSGSHHHLVEN